MLPDVTQSPVTRLVPRAILPLTDFQQATGGVKFVD